MKGLPRRAAGWARASLRGAAGGADRLHDRWRAAPPGVAVLIYHRVGGGSDSAVDLPLDVFRRQLAHLAEHHRVISLDAAVRAIEAGEAADGVVITFDDGAADYAEHAAPALIETGLPSTLYLVTSAPDVGTLPWGVPSVSWAALRDLTATGLVDVQSHTHDHRVLHHADGATTADQLDRSIELIADRLGSAPQHFAYPKAVPGSRPARLEVAARFRSAALARHGRNAHLADLHVLRRTPISRQDDMDDFAAKAKGGRRLEGWARHQVASVRYRRATT